MDANLSQYRIFAVTAQTGSISGAARKLYISQPAVSKSISNLEDSVGAPLFIRKSRGVSLTDEGNILYKYVCEAFDNLETGENELRRYHNLGIGHLSIGASSTLSRYRLLPYLSRFTSAYPHISIGLSCQPTRQTLQMLDEESIDIGLIARQKDMKNIGFFSLGEIQDIFVARPSYLKNMAIRENSKAFSLYIESIIDGIPCDDPEVNKISEYDWGRHILNEATLMLLNRGNATRDFVDYYLEENHIHPANLIEITTMDLLIEFTKAGLGIACVIENFVEEELTAKNLIRIPVGGNLNPREIGFAWNESKPCGRSLEIFKEFIARPEE